MRVRLVVLVTAAFLLAALILVPEIIEAKRANSAAAAPANSVANPFQGKRQEMTVGQSIRNDTSPPVRDMNQRERGNGFIKSLPELLSA